MNYAIIILSLFIFCIFFDKIIYPRFRGFMGEFWVKKELNKLPTDSYKILNDIMIMYDNNTYQIDHIVISKYGIFVIEMKNYYGKIIGDEYKDNWIQKFKKSKFNFKNPIHQNYGHILALSQTLNLDINVFYNIVCFSNQAKLKINCENVVQLDNLTKLIKKYDKELNLDTDKIYLDINNLNILDKDLRKNHVKRIRKIIKEKSEKRNNNICPKCGSNLIEKNGKYGKFIGCSNYPKCKYIKK